MDIVCNYLFVYRFESFVSGILKNFNVPASFFVLYVIIIRLTVLYFFSLIVVSKGQCNFQSGLCGLKADKNATFHWTVGSGQTPTESTGPSYDHTSLNKDGKTSQISQNRQEL